ncbi:MAG: pyruvate kinase, partial [Odoribacter sp.]|nr:pyruvate kinase [Odoribacter sp.]
NKCIESKKPVIIATQMLHTMIEHPRPTRAEVSDIANAVFSSTDAIMLSGETAYGEYPMEAVKVMSRVAEANESTLPPDYDRNLVRINNETTAALARVAVRMTTMLPIKAVVLDTMTGRTARYLSAFRGGLPVYARCYDTRVMRELALSFGVIPYYSEKPESRDEFMKSIPDMLLEQGYRLDDLVLVIGGSFGAARGASFLEVCRLSDARCD